MQGRNGTIFRGMSLLILEIATFVIKSERNWRDEEGDMIQLLKIPTLFAMLLALLPVAVNAKADDMRLREMMIAIGADVWIESFASGLMDPPDADGSVPADPGWQIAAQENFRHEEIFDEMIAAMDGSFSAQELDGIMGFLTSDLGALVTAMEVEAQNPDIADGVDMAAPQIVEELARSAPDRLDAYRDMLDAIGAVDSGVTTALNLNFAILSGMSATGRGTAQLSEGDILTLLAGQEPRIRKQVETGSLENAAFTYRDLSDADLEAYRDFLTSDLGRKLYATMNAAADAVMIKRARAFGARIVELQGTTEL